MATAHRTDDLCICDGAAPHTHPTLPIEDDAGTRRLPIGEVQALVREHLARGPVCMHRVGGGERYGQTTGPVLRVGSAE